MKIFWRLQEAREDPRTCQGGGPLRGGQHKLGVDRNVQDIDKSEKQPKSRGEKF